MNGPRVNTAPVETGSVIFKATNMVMKYSAIGTPNTKKRQGAAGRVIGTSLNYQSARSELRIFDARRVSDGPVATAVLPYALPLGLHGKFA